MKLNLNSILLLALLAIAAWYVFFRSEGTEAVIIPADPKTNTPEKTVIVPKPTIIEKIVEVIKYRDRVRVASRVANQAAAGNVVLDSFTPTVNFWKGR